MWKAFYENFHARKLDDKQNKNTRNKQKNTFKPPCLKTKQGGRFFECFYVFFTHFDLFVCDFYVIITCHSLKKHYIFVIYF